MNLSELPRRRAVRSAMLVLALGSYLGLAGCGEDHHGDRDHFDRGHDDRGHYDSDHFDRDHDDRHN